LLLVTGGNEVRSGAFSGQAALAARIAAAGFPVFRFDRRGVGDSAGENEGFRKSARDIHCALAAFRVIAPNVERVVGFGNCDAASALMLAKGAEFDALVLSNPWTIEGDDATPPPAAVRARYAEKLKNPREVIRLLTGGVNLAKLARGLAHAGRRSAKRSSLAEEMAAGLAAFDGPVRIVLAGADRTAQVFAEGWDPSDSRVVWCEGAGHSWAEPHAREFLDRHLLEMLRGERQGLANEQARQLDVGRPAELPYSALFGETEAGVDQGAGVFRPARRVAADVNDAPHPAFGDARHLFACARARRIEQDAVEPRQFLALERVAEQVAVMRFNRHWGSGRSEATGEVRVARAFISGDRLAECERECAEAGEQVRHHRAGLKPIAGCSDQGIFPVLGRLQERTWRERHRNVTEGNRDGFGFPDGFRAIAEIDRQPGQRILFGELKDRLRCLEPFHREVLQATINSLVGYRQFDIDGPPPTLGGQQTPQRGDEREQLGPHDVALRQVDNAMRAVFAKPDDWLPALFRGMQRCPPTGARRRKVGVPYTLSVDALRACSVNHPVAHESSERLFVQMLELTSPAATEVTARRCRTVRPRLHAAITEHEVTWRGEGDVAAARGHAVTFGGDPQDFLSGRHRKLA
jgi:exosortase A-associated hydrolase 1